MLKTIIILLASILAMAGIVMIYDARDITGRVFGFGDQNEATLGLKIIGFVFCIIAAFIIYFQIK